jgi:glycosyltransferase involved in cell wall biosynthesis
VVLTFGLSTPAAVQVAWAKKNLKLTHQFRFIGVDSHLPSEFNSGSIWLKKLFYATFRFFFSSLLNQQLDKAIAVQEGTLEIINHYYGITKNVQLVSHGTNTDQYTFSAKSRQMVRRQLSISANEFVIIYTGKIIPAKGVDILVKAFTWLSKKYSDMTLLLVGAGPQEYLDQMFNQLDKATKAKIKVTGFQDHTKLPGYYSAAELAVWPLQESMAMIDAASCSVPFIANHTLGAKERVANQNALLYKQDDERDLANKIESLYLDPNQRKAMGRRGRELVEKSFSWNQVAERYLA